MASIVLFMGPTGSGKSAQGEIVATSREWIHISSGDLLRGADTKNAASNAGDLASSQTIEHLVEHELSQLNGVEVMILDGFPRTLDQAGWLDRYIKKRDDTITAVVVLDVSKDVSRTRLEARKRSDDGLAAFEEKWKVYEAQTIPVIRSYADRGLVTTIPADGSLKVVTNRIQKVFTS